MAAIAWQGINIMDARLQGEPDVGSTAPPAASRNARILLYGLGGLAILALFARIMTFDLQRDEEFYLSASILYSPASLYQQINFSHFPNLPILLRTLYALTGTDHYLLGGRLVIFAAWLASLLALWLFGQRYRLGIAQTGLLAALLLLNPVLLDAAGMAVTNNFIAAPFLLFGILAFLRGTQGGTARPYTMLLAGFLLSLGAGFKANYVLISAPFGVAALLMPQDQSFAGRLRNGVLPLVLGGIVGGLPTLYFFAQDPAGFIAHCFSFHRGPQIAYWLAHPEIHDPKFISPRDKLMLAHRIWLSGTTMLLPMLIITLLAVAAWSTPAKGLAWLGRFRTGPILLMASIVAISVLASFMPTPSFPQYHSTAFVFVILLIGLMLHALEQPGQSRARPVIAAVFLMAVVAGGPMLFPALTKLARPRDWTGVVVHEDARKLADSIARGGAAGPVATLLPIYPLEGGRAVYPHLALDQFVYRASDYIPADQRRYFHNLAAPGTIGAILAANPPSAILLGSQDRLEEPLVRFARVNGYVAQAVQLRHAEEGSAPLLLVRRPRP